MIDRNPSTGLAAASDLLVRRPVGLVWLTAIALAILLGAWLSLDNAPQVFGAAALVGFAFLAVWRPFIATCCFWFLLPLLPENGHMFGHFIPSLFQTCVPVLVIAVLAGALRERRAKALRLRVTDVLLLGFMLAGFGGLLLHGRVDSLKYYTNRMVFVPMVYVLGRLIPMDRAQWQTLLKAQIVAISISSLLILREAVTGSSYPYTGQDITIEGVDVPVGAFGGHWRAAAFLALWPPLCLYGMSRSKSRLWWLAFAACCVLSLTGLVRTLERAQIAGCGVGILLCCVHPAIRKQGTRLLLVGLPLLVLGSGFLLNEVSDRFSDDSARETRRFYRQEAAAQMASDEWHPVFGTGFARGITIQWGKDPSHRHSIHNTPLQLLVEFGLAGALLAVGMGVCLGLEWVRLLRTCIRRGGDSSLLLAVAGVTGALLAMSYYHNIYTMSQVTAVWWWLMGLLMGHERLFTSRDNGPPDAQADHAEVAGAAGHLP